MGMCFWCGEEPPMTEDFLDNEGNLIDVPAVYKPCRKCYNEVSMGFTFMEVTHEPNGRTDEEYDKGIYPTGRIMTCAYDLVYEAFPQMRGCEGVYVQPRAFKRLFLN